MWRCEFILHRVEVVNVVLVVVVAEEGTTPVGRTNGHSTDVGNGEGRFWLALTSIIKGSIPVGGGVDIWEAAL